MQNIHRDLYRLALPATLAMVVHHFFRINDQFFVKPLGAEAQSAVAVGSMVAILLVAFGEMVAVGTLAVAARRLGEGNELAAHATIRRGLRLGVGVGLVLALVVNATLPLLCSTLIPGDDARVERQLCADYLFWIGSGQIIMAAVPCLDASFLAMKDSRTPLLLQILAVLANVLLNWLLVPVLEVQGVGIATVASRLLSLSLGLWILHARGVGLPWLGGRQGAGVLRILKIGLPACIAVGIYSIVYQVILALTIKEFGPAARTVLGIGFGIETIFYCMYWGVGTAVSSLVGRYLGEGRPERALAVSRAGLKTNLVIGLSISVIFWTIGRQMVEVLTREAEVVAASVSYLNYMAVAQPFQALQVGFEQAMIGAGSTWPVMFSSTSMNLIRIPLAHLLAIGGGLGLAGVWWAINISSVGKCLWSGILHQRQRWLRTQV